MIEMRHFEEVEEGGWSSYAAARVETSVEEVELHIVLKHPRQMDAFGLVDTWQQSTQRVSKVDMNYSANSTARVSGPPLQNALSAVTKRLKMQALDMGSRYRR